MWKHELYDVLISWCVQVNVVTVVGLSVVGVAVGVVRSFLTPPPPNVTSSSHSSYSK